MRYYIVLLVMTLLGAMGSFYLKKASGAAGQWRRLISSPSIYLGGSFYFISALLNIYVLKYLEYSVVLPLTSITYIWTFLIAHRKLGEEINGQRAGGMILILVGSIFISVA